jgi:hypothetical protein
MVRTLTSSVAVACFAVLALAAAAHASLHWQGTASATFHSQYGNSDPGSGEFGGSADGSWSWTIDDIGPSSTCSGTCQSTQTTDDFLNYTSDWAETQDIWKPCEGGTPARNTYAARGAGGPPVPGFPGWYVNFGVLPGQARWYEFSLLQAADGQGSQTLHNCYGPDGNYPDFSTASVLLSCLGAPEGQFVSGSSGAILMGSSSGSDQPGTAQSAGGCSSFEAMSWRGMGTIYSWTMQWNLVVTCLDGTTPTDSWACNHDTSPPATCMTDPSLCPPPPPPTPACVASPSLCPLPPEENTLAQRWKSGWHDANIFFAVSGGAFGAVVNPATEGVGLVFDMADVGGQAISRVLGDDPPDSNYKQIALPVFPSLPKVKASALLNRKAVRALIKVGTNGVHSYGFGMALLHCIERAQGAAIAGDAQWVQQQRGCAAANATQLAQTFRDQVSLRRVARKALVASDLPDSKISKAAIRHSLTQLKRGKLPGALSRVAARLKLDSGQRQDLISNLLAAQPKPGLRLLDAVYGPDVSRALKAAAATANGVANQFSAG